MRESIDRPVILAASGNEDLGFRRKGWNESLEPGRNMIELPWGSSAGVTLRPEISLRAVALEFVVQRFVRLIIPRRLKQSRLGCRRLSPVTRLPVRIFAKTLTRSRPALLRKATVATNSGLGWVNDPNRRSLVLGLLRYGDSKTKFLLLVPKHFVVFENLNARKKGKPPCPK